MTLTIQDLRALGELLGSVAVLATLIYLALQTRQNTMAIDGFNDRSWVDRWGPQVAPVRAAGPRTARCTLERLLRASCPAG